MKLDNYLTSYKQINSKWIKDFNVIPLTIKLLEENIGGMLFDIYISNVFLDMSPQARETEPIFFFNFIYLFIYLWLCWVFVSVRGLSLVAASGGHSSSRCTGLSLSRPLLLRRRGSRRAGSVIVAHGPSCSAARRIFPDQGSNPCPLH